MRIPVPRRFLVVSLCPVLVAFALLLPGVALAEVVGPQWTISSVSTPTNFSPSAKPGEDYYKVLVTNTGGAAAGCTEAHRVAEVAAGASPVLCHVGSPVSDPVTITDVLPEGLVVDPGGVFGENTLSSASGLRPNVVYGGEQRGASFKCVLATCTYSAVVIPDETLEITVPVDVLSGAQALSPLVNTVQVSGGGAPSALQSESTTISGTPAGFGIPPGAATTSLSSLQAGAHPDITSTYGFSTVNTGGVLAANPKDVTYRLPSGFASNFADTPQCTQAQYLAEACPVDTQVGVTTVFLEPDEIGIRGEYEHYLEAVYNLVPETGQLATVAFSISDDFFVEGQVSLRPFGERGAAGEPLEPYGADVSFHNIDADIQSVVAGSLTVWGVPSDPVHNAMRRRAGSYAIDGPTLGFGASDEGVSPVPYFTNPTSCAGPLRSEFQVDSWEEPGHYATAQMEYGPLDGCDRLMFEPQLEVQPSANSAESPTGLNVNLEVPQHEQDAYGVVAPHLHDAKVVLPAGMTVNPSAGAGLQACTEAEFQYESEVVNPEPGRGCPKESKLGTARAKSPGVPNNEEATGSLYLATPYENKFGTLLAIDLVLRIPDRGVVVTAPGKVELDPVTGQLTTTFQENPQLPVSDFVFTFHQGATSPLVTPPTCGAYTTHATFNPWSEPLQEHTLLAKFTITSGVEGGACPSGGGAGGIPFHPLVTAGTENPNAGAYSPLNILIDRKDGEQEITGFASQLPLGLTGNLSGIPFCGEADIQRARGKTGAQEQAEPSCPAASQIGYTVADAGVGQVLAQAPGKIYLAGPFEGAPFSVVGIVAAKVGPFDLGTVVVHFPLDINPITAGVTIPAGAADQIPHIIKGIVVHVREIRVYIDRAKFMLNPTDCEQMSFAATVIGGGADPTNPAGYDPVTATSPFRVTACQALAFKPSFKASTSGKTSRANGASLHVTLGYPSAPQGTQANIKSVKVELPKQLPSRLTTLQKACTAGQFEANPAGCPAASIVGHAKAITPILPVPLEGPAYFVSYGGAKFPELVIVLQGYGVTIDLHGETFISKKGITSSTFRTVPDQPVTSFELTLPQGPDSALAANGNLCALTKTVLVKRKVKVRSKGRTRTVTRKVKSTVSASMLMPTAFTAQNGAVIKQNTPISVTGCPKAKTKKKAKGGRQGKKKK